MSLFSNGCSFTGDLVGAHSSTWAKNSTSVSAGHLSSNIGNLVRVAHRVVEEFNATAIIDVV